MLQSVKQVDGQRIGDLAYVFGGLLRLRLNYNQHLQQFSNPAGIEDDEIWLDPYLFSEPGQIVNPPQEPHGASQLCRDLPQDIDHQGLGGTTFSHFIQSNTEQESYTYLLPSSDEPMQVASVLNLCGFSFLFTEPFISQRSREEATHKENCSGKRPFTCICGLATDDIVEHRKHLKGCATGKRGRPKKQNAV
ncbi:hypothetical protein FOIG_13960 [Fusarium odoratissimum NRRL 54006]|uniref:Uncharacterized protein n=1 Tax=Fusarium odoratissimum (strain NRRL 54006) TaxID=1089451 RepID=X0J9M7_FUSO5|nr:uncharacterized protein FOIG_13960 [Fusarium odoratissimum NRRL 54006]EXL93076.1 hypothetical protein FOIG_13960 [Fusarium odoratissimum NRRL 54006]